MMYTTTPVIDQYWNVHTGFYAISAMCVALFIFLLIMWKEEELGTLGLIIWAFLLSSLTYFAYHNSYQPQKFYANTQVVGKFIKFESEGYSERSGKQMVDRHYLYVVYEIEGRYAIFQTDTSITWPKEAVFYRNPTQ